MDTYKLIKRLEGIVEENRSRDFNLDNSAYNLKLLKAHNLLARLYYDIGVKKQAHSHLREAEYEFHKMLESVGTRETEISKYNRKLLSTAMQIEYPLEEQLRISYAEMLVKHDKKFSYNIWDTVKEYSKYSKGFNEKNKYRLDDYLNDEEDLDPYNPYEN